MNGTEKEIRLSEAARRLGVDWATAWKLVLKRKLDAQQRANGRWYVQAASVETFARANALEERRGAEVLGPKYEARR